MTIFVTLRGFSLKMTEKYSQTVFLKGMYAGIPIALGYYAVAFSLGIIARNAGLTAFEGFFSSLFTRASAGEYGGYTLMAAGAGCFELILMCFVTNLRYVLMSTALTQKIAEGTSLVKRLLVACCVTDEIFAISIAYPGKLDPAYTFGAISIAGMAWGAGTASGIAVGNILPANIVSALSVALYGMFIAIIIPPAKNDKTIALTIAISFLMSYLCSILPCISDMSAGMRTILLTIVISALAALLKPIKQEAHHE